MVLSADDPQTSSFSRALALPRDRLAPAAWLDIAAPIVGGVTMLVLCLVASPRKYFWIDEMLSWLFVVEPTVDRLWEALHDTINASPPTYYLIARLWAALFGASELSLRMFSAVCFALSLMVCWWLLRIVFGAWPAAVASLATFFASRIVLFQVVEARFYGLFLLEATLALTVQVVYFRDGRIRWGLLAANAALHGALITTHYYGLFYCATLAAAAVLMIPVARRQALALLLSMGVGWLAFVPCIPAFLIHREYGKGHFWLAPPTVRDLAASYTSEISLLTPSVWIGCGLFWIGLTAFALRSWRTPDAPFEAGELAGPRAEQALAAAVLALSLVPLGTWILARLGATMFLNRYMVPNLLCWSVVAAAAVRAFLRRLAAEGSGQPEGKSSLWMPQTVLALVMLFVLGKAVESELHAEFLPPPGGDESHLPADVPIAFESIHRFLPRLKYGPSPGRYWLILDRQAALLPDAPRPALNDHQLALALKRQYPEMQIVESDEFLAAHPRFIASDGGTLWFESRLAGSGSYTVTPADSPGAKPQFFIVERKGSE